MYLEDTRGVAVLWAGGEGLTLVDGMTEDFPSHVGGVAMTGGAMRLMMLMFLFVTEQGEAGVGVIETAATPRSGCLIGPAVAGVASEGFEVRERPEGVRVVIG